MHDYETIQAYVNNFRRHISPNLKPGIGLSCKIYPAQRGGAVLEFSIGPNIANEDHFEAAMESVNAILKVVPQRMVGGNIDALRFGGTNISMEPNRILIIKGEDIATLWSDEGAQSDVEKIIRGQAGAQG
ncbi:MAG: hypothetical protein KKH04_14340 [Proteobacteria bacterium]|nr:hypothetical protein [Pseudomonadota bacterium]